MLDSTSEPSPELLRSLHQDYLRQLRNRTIGWMAVLLVAPSLAVIAGVGFPAPFWFALMLAGIQAVRAGVEWSSERDVDPVEAASAESVAAREAERDRVVTFQKRMRERRPIATGMIAGLVVLVTVVEWLTAGSTSTTVERAGLVKPLVTQGEWWRLITATFLHANLLHLTANVTALLAFGRIIETFVPRAWLFFTYLVAGIAGSLASWWLFPNTAGLGASGAVMGLAGFVVVLGWRRPDDLPPAVRESVLMTIVLTGCIGALLFFVIDNAAHGGGLVAGALVALVVVRADGQTVLPSVALRAVGVVSAVLLLLGAGRSVRALVRGPLAIARLAGAAVPVTSVSAAIRHERDGSFVVVTNSGNRVLEAYEIELGGPAATRTIWRDDCCVTTERMGPIRPGRSLRLPLNHPGALQAKVTAALFADGTFEGLSEGHNQIVQRRRAVLDEGTFWMSTLDEAVKLDPGDAGRHLDVQLGARSASIRIASSAAEAFGIPALIGVAKSDPARFRIEVARTKARIASTRQAIQGKLR